MFPIGATYYQGGELWNTYLPSFYIKNFVFKFERTADVYEIFLINKRNFLKVVDEHITEFRKILGENITSENLFFQIIDNRNCIRQILKEDHCLVGILLGYGYKNSQMYKRREEVSNLIACFPPPFALPEQIDILQKCDIPLIDYSKNKCSEINNIKDLLLEYSDIMNTLKGAFPDSCEILSLFLNVGFLADHNSTETKSLIEKYKKTEIDIMRAFMSDNFLEAVLCKMAED